MITIIWEPIKQSWLQPTLLVAILVPYFYSLIYQKRSFLFQDIEGVFDQKKNFVTERKEVLIFMQTIFVIWCKTFFFSPKRLKNELIFLDGEDLDHLRKELERRTPFSSKNRNLYCKNSFMHRQVLSELAKDIKVQMERQLGTSTNVKGGGIFLLCLKIN